MVYSREYYEKNRTLINSKTRLKYCSETRKKQYNDTRDTVLTRMKEDRATCPLCKLDFRRLYIRKHIHTRHKLTELPDEIIQVLDELKLKKNETFQVPTSD